MCLLYQAALCPKGFDDVQRVEFELRDKIARMQDW